jgi:predicted DCC family thiol-disulfide oxidoreductase YuxK
LGGGFLPPNSIQAQIMPANFPANYVLYDGDCPVCANYIWLARLRTDHPDINVIDARTAPDLVAHLRGQGIDVHDTMVLQLGEMRLVGAQAFSYITRKDAPQRGVMARALWAVLRALAHPKAARFSYPVLAFARKALLKILGITRL